MLVTGAAAVPFFVLRPTVVTPDFSLLFSGGWTRSSRPGIRSSKPQPTRKGGPLLVFVSVMVKKNTTHKVYHCNHFKVNSIYIHIAVKYTYVHVFIQLQILSVHLLGSRHCFGAVDVQISLCKTCVSVFIIL